jgi:hypothetical protein
MWRPLAHSFENNVAIMSASLQDQLFHLLAGASPPAEANSGPGYSCSGPLPSRVQPGLDVEGVGRISLPLTDEKALELKAACSLAPFGRGTETVVDTAVRNTFQLTPQQFRLTNPSEPARRASIRPACNEFTQLLHACDDDDCRMGE